MCIHRSRFSSSKPLLTIEWTNWLDQRKFRQPVSHNPYTLFLLIRCTVCHLGMLSSARTVLSLRCQAKGIHDMVVVVNGAFLMLQCNCNGWKMKQKEREIIPKMRIMRRRGRRRKGGSSRFNPWLTYSRDLASDVMMGTTVSSRLAYLESSSRARLYL